MAMVYMKKSRMNEAFSTLRKNLLKSCVIFIYLPLNGVKSLTNICEKLLRNIWELDSFMPMPKRLGISTIL